MLSLCHGQRASSDSNMMLPAGDGRVVGITVYVFPNAKRL